MNNTINSNTFIIIPLKVEITEGGGDTGASLVINDVTVAGPGPWRGEHVVYDFDCNLTVNIANQPAYRNLRSELDLAIAIASTERECREYAEKNFSDLLQCLESGVIRYPINLQVKQAVEAQIKWRDAKNALLKRAASVIDKLMGDSDLDSDESEEMKVCQDIQRHLGASPGVSVSSAPEPKPEDDGGGEAMAEKLKAQPDFERLYISEKAENENLKTKLAAVSKALALTATGG